MNIPSPRSRKRARIEIIPLIDVIFFLLATFMMVSLSMVKNNGIKVNLPAAATSAPQEKNDRTTISVTKDGNLFFNQESLQISDLPARLEQLKAQQPDPKVFINGDEKAFFGNAVEVLDDLRKAGITKVAIDTKLKQ
ncbi:MAG TPA: biopolymer transporter ExbD [Verrucomicrobiae bacterium]|nr:biopolymer transporter ExbD [Verrucomicrobiae bacterium]